MLMVGLRKDTSDKGITELTGLTRREMKKGLRYASFWTWLINNTLHLYEPVTLIKDHSIMSYYTSMKLTVEEFDDGELKLGKVRFEQKYAHDWMVQSADTLSTLSISNHYDTDAFVAHNLPRRYIDLPTNTTFVESCCMERTWKEGSIFMPITSTGCVPNSNPNHEFDHVPDCKDVIPAVLHP